jgi:hypothetical protein
MFPYFLLSYDRFTPFILLSNTVIVSVSYGSTDERFRHMKCREQNIPGKPKVSHFLGHVPYFENIKSSHETALLRCSQNLILFLLYWLRSFGFMRQCILLVLHEFHYGTVKSYSVLSLSLRLSLFSPFPVVPTLELRASVKPFVSLQFLNPKTIGRTPWTGDQHVARTLPT